MIGDTGFKVFHRNDENDILRVPHNKEMTAMVPVLIHRRY